MTMSSPTTLLPNGISNAKPGWTLESYMLPDRSAVNEVYDDFNSYVTALYTVSGTGTTNSLSNTPGVGGWLEFTTSAVSDASQIQIPVASISLAGQTNQSGVPPCAWYKTRVQVTALANASFALGLMEVLGATTAIPTFTDGIWFSMTAGSSTVNIVAKTGGTAVFTAFQVATLVNATPLTLGFWFEAIGGGNVLHIYVNEQNVANIPSLTTWTTALLSPTISMASGASAAGIVYADYLLGAQLRQPLS